MGLESTNSFLLYPKSQILSEGRRRRCCRRPPRSRCCPCDAPLLPLPCPFLLLLSPWPEVEAGPEFPLSPSSVAILSPPPPSLSPPLPPPPSLSPLLPPPPSPPPSRSAFSSLMSRLAIPSSWQNCIATTSSWKKARATGSGSPRATVCCCRGGADVQAPAAPPPAHPALATATCSLCARTYSNMSPPLAYSITIARYRGVRKTSWNRTMCGCPAQRRWFMISRRVALLTPGPRSRNLTATRLLGPAARSWARSTKPNVPWCRGGGGGSQKKGAGGGGNREQEREKKKGAAAKRGLHGVSRRGRPSSSSSTAAVLVVPLSLAFQHFHLPNCALKPMSLPPPDRKISPH